MWSSVAWVLNSSSDSQRQIANRASSPCVRSSAWLAQKLPSNEWALFFSALQVAYLIILVSWFSLLGTSELNSPSISSTYPVAGVLDTSIICVLLLFYPSFSFPEFYLPYCWLPCYVHLIKKGCLKPFLRMKSHKQITFQRWSVTTVDDGHGKQTRAGKMVRRLKTLASKHRDLSLIPGSHM